MIASQDSAQALVGKVGIDLVFTAGAAGVVPVTFTASTGITSVTKSSNDYIVIFDSTYLIYVGGYGNVKQASVDAAAATFVKVTAFDAGAAGGASVTLSPLKGSDGTAVALATGDILQFHFEFTRVPQPNAA